MGGVIRNQLLPRNLEFLHWSDVGPGIGSIKNLLVSNVMGVETPPQLPLCIGTSTIPLRDGGFVVLGGGATCFSMGTFWNKGIFSFYPATQNNWEMLPSTDITGWIHEKTLDIVPGERHIPVAPMLKTGAMSDRQSIRTIPHVGLETAEDFSRIVRKGQPIVLERLNIGRCVSEWNLDHLAEKVGHERKVCTSHSFNLSHGERELDTPHRC
jgi:tRNA wybutosine-synthesizing protein 4